MRIELLKPYAGQLPGAIVDFPTGVAQALLERTPPFAKLALEEQANSLKVALFGAPQDKAIQPVTQRKKRRSPFGLRD